ncbi:hypothetical protein MXB_5079, partial [Myxobolus squamalis]
VTSYISSLKHGLVPQYQISDRVSDPVADVPADIAELLVLLHNPKACVDDLFADRDLSPAEEVFLHYSKNDHESYHEVADFLKVILNMMPHYLINSSMMLETDKMNARCA